MVSVILGSSYHCDVYLIVQVSIKFGFNSLFDALTTRWKVMIDSWACVVIGVHVNVSTDSLQPQTRATDDTNNCDHTVKTWPTDKLWSAWVRLLTARFGAGSQQVHHIQMISNVNQYLQLWHQGLVLAGCGSIWNTGTHSPMLCFKHISLFTFYMCFYDDTS